MGGMMSSEYVDKYDQKRRKHGHGCILIAGLDSSGKTLLTYRLVTRKPINPTPTTGHNKETVARAGKKWDIFDVGGTLLVRETWRLYARAADGIIFVVDSCDERRFGEAKQWLRALYAEDGAIKRPLLVLANKQDFCTAMQYAKIETLIGFDDVPVKQKAMMPCSGLTGDNVETAFDWLLDTILSNEKLQEH